MDLRLTSLCIGAQDLGNAATLRITAHDGSPTNVAVVCTENIGCGPRLASVFLLWSSAFSVYVSSVPRGFCRAHFAAELFEIGGLDPWGASVLVAKSPAGFRATYGEAAGLM